jgi:type IV pilus assembly protein PilO
MAISDTINVMPSYQRWIVLVLLLVAIAGVFIWMVYIPKQQEIVALKNEISTLQTEIQTNQQKAAKLVALTQEKVAAEKQLAVLQRELPVEAEAIQLLKQINELGVKSGLDMSLWKPGETRIGTGGLYIELPVEVQVAGGYHAVAGFFDLIGHLERIVNVADIKMSNPRLGGNEDVVIATTFVATAFAAVPPKPAAKK